MKMKYIHIAIVGLLLSVVVGCNDKLEDYYADPNETTEAEVSKLFTYMLRNDYIRPTYWDYRTFILPTTAMYSQFYGFITGNRMYQPNVSYTEDRWEGFYTGGVLNSYRSMEQAYNSLSEEDQEGNEIFMQLGKIVLMDQAAQLVDYWGDIPYTEAGLINLTNTMTNGAFDDAAGIYTSIIADLDEINTYLAGFELSSTVQTQLETQDILNFGDLDAWRRYANSVRLRLLMRISTYDENTAQSEILEMLSNSATYPLVESNDDNILLNMYPSGSSLYSEVASAFSEMGPYAGEFIIEEVMVANNDPRTEVFWDAGLDGFVGVPMDATTSAQNNLTANGYIASFDSATFIYNWNIPGVLVTAAEVSFIKAEAYQRWGSGDAEAAYTTGIEQSVEFYFNLNQNAVMANGAPVSREAFASPSTAEMEAFLAESGIAYTGTDDEKLEKIGTQKWLNYFVLQAGQAWSEIRRTGYPELTFVVDPATGELPPNRLIYPNTEKSNNGANYAEVSAEDTRDTKVFWDVD